MKQKYFDNCAYKVAFYVRLGNKSRRSKIHFRQHPSHAVLDAEPDRRGVSQYNKQTLCVRLSNSASAMPLSTRSNLSIPYPFLVA